MRWRRPAAVATGVVLLLPLSGCDDGDSGDSDMDTFRGDGYAVGYPDDWRSSGDEPIFEGASFEVVMPTKPGGLPKAALSVFDEDETQSLDDLIDQFIGLSRTDSDFRLLGRTKRNLRGTEAYVVRKSYTDNSVLLRQVDVFFSSPTGDVVDVRMLFLDPQYDEGVVRAVIESVDVDTAAGV